VSLQNRVEEDYREPPIAFEARRRGIVLLLDTDGRLKALGSKKDTNLLLEISLHRKEIAEWLKLSAALTSPET
jgi:hypothetical protein